VLFDGVCNLCNGFVNFALDRDPGGRLVFGALQSRAAEPLLERAGLGASRPDSLVVVDPDGAAWVRSAAALRVARRLRPPWPQLAAIAALVPRALRDAVYDHVARRRYRWFGRRETCRVPTSVLRARFLEEGAPPPGVATQDRGGLANDP
jgi:predicted DCC family thiol-disulfide oxidoreductase YuxK